MAGVRGRSGGQRVGAGRPPKTDAERWLDGNAGKRGAKPRKPPARPVIVPVVTPEALNSAERAVWLAHERFAQEALTLTPATAGDFAMLCVLEVELAEAIAERRKEGWTTRGMFLAKEVRGLAQRVEAKRRAFRLAPMGKPIVEVQEPQDEWAEFDGPNGETVQ